MKKLLAVLVIVFAATAAWAQPTFTFSSGTPCAGDTFCVDVTVKDFTDISKVKFPVYWDTAVLRFVGTRNYGLEKLDTSSFNRSRAAEGLLFLDWVFAADCKGNVDKPDNFRVFSICFVSKGTYGSTTSVGIVEDPAILKNNDPEPLEVTRPTPNPIVPCPNIGLRQQSGIVSTCVRPLHLFASQSGGNTGDLVCTDVSVTGFDGLTALQLTMEYDSTVLRYGNIILTGGLRNLSKESFATPANVGFGEGRITMSWGWADKEVPSVTIPDSTVIFQLCHTIVGECEKFSNINFTSSLTKLEAINVTADSEYIIPLVVHPGLVQVGKCAPTGLQLFANCGGPVQLNDEVCVKVTAKELKDITQMSFLMKFNSNILKYRRIQSYNVKIPGFARSHTNTNNAANGILGINWIPSISGATADVPDGETLFEICFTVVGLGGNAPIVFDPINAFVTKKGSTANIGIAPNNCSVEVIQPDGVQLEIVGGFGPPGDTICLDYRVGRFQEITELDFTSYWDPEHLRFIEIKNIALTGLAVDSFQLDGAGDGGLFTVEWSRITPVTLTDKTTIFQACFEVIGDPPGDLGTLDNCKSVGVIPDFPVASKAVSSQSNGNNIGLTAIPGQVCIINPVGYYLFVGRVDTYKQDTACVSFRVANFKNITQSDFILNWDPTALGFVSVKPNASILGGLKIGQNILTPSVNVGKLDFTWGDGENAQSLPDSTSLFEVCFTAIGEVGKCYDLEVNTDPFPSAQTLEGPGSVRTTGGSVCIKDRLTITKAVITPVTCFNTADGTVTLEVEGGQGNIFYNWEVLPKDYQGSRVRFSNKARFLPVGEVAVTIFDESNPPLLLRDTFYVPLIDTLPKADAGTDKTLTCKFSAAVRLGVDCAGTECTKYTYNWSSVDGELPGTSNRSVALASKAGTYILSVSDKVTGCTVRDTALVFPATKPRANAGRNQVLSCLSDTVYLDASLSTPTDSLSFRWQGLDGGDIMPGDSNKIKPRALEVGLYRLVVQNIVNACTDTAFVNVTEATEVPVAAGGSDVELNCKGLPVTLAGSSAANLRPVTYAWFDPAGKKIASGTQVQVSALGSYVFQAQEEGSGCIARDTVRVVPSSTTPSINAGVDTAFTCRQTQIRLNPTVANTTAFKLSWKAENGGTLEVGGDTARTPRVLTAGRFILQVTDTASACSAMDTIVISEDTRKPTVSAGKAGVLSCFTPEYTLQGTASSPNGSFSALWTLAGATVRTDSLQVKVNKAGSYRLTVTDTRNGCSAADSVSIVSTIDTPKVVVNTVNATITCAKKEISLNVSVSPAANYSVNWITSGGRIVSGSTSLSPIVGAPGIYQAMVTNTVTGCKGEANVPVFADTLRPVANAGRDLALTCALQADTLNGSASTNSGKIAYAWSSLNGRPNPVPASGIKAVVSQPGQYLLQVRDTSSGCSAVDTVLVSLDTVSPKVVLAAPAVLTCTVNEVTIDGDKSEKGSKLVPEWSAQSGQTIVPTANTYQIKVSQTGVFSMRLRNTGNGCVGSASVEVTQNRTAPDAVTNPKLELPCQGAVRTLDATGTSTGTGITYLWTTLSGKGTITDEKTLAAKINSPGMYGLRVTNASNGCTDTASVTVIIDPKLVLANAGADQVACADDAQLTGNLPTGASGQWTSRNGASIEAPAEFLTEVFGLKLGTNVFVWTLSKAECPNYSSDSLIVTRESAPNANNDELVVEAIQRSGSVNVVQNDQFAFSMGYTLALSAKPKLGRVDSILNGVMTYAVPPRIYGKDEFTYSLCSKACPTLCDTAIVKVDVKFDPNLPQAPVANAITPNGDGANDELRFEVLENGDPTVFPDNHIVIFNRWGNIVYEAKPYNNDWRGLNAAGKELPHGTYYYILRLDISKGLIIQGDVTILK
jgi:gliding motility-associated-like protein